MEISADALITELKRQRNEALDEAATLRAALVESQSRNEGVSDSES